MVSRLVLWVVNAEPDWLLLPYLILATVLFWSPGTILSRSLDIFFSYIPLLCTFHPVAPKCSDRPFWSGPEWSSVQKRCIDFQTGKTAYLALCLWPPATGRLLANWGLCAGNEVSQIQTKSRVRDSRRCVIINAVLCCFKASHLLPNLSPSRTARPHVKCLDNNVTWCRRG